jgi:hypothetical protein
VNVQWRQILHNGRNSEGCALYVRAGKFDSSDSDLCNFLKRKTIGKEGSDIKENGLAVGSVFYEMNQGL